VSALRSDPRSIPGAMDQAERLRSMIREFRQPVKAVEPARRVPTITVCSGKGGVGKSMLALNLSIALAESGLAPVLIDGDVGTANVDVLCGLSPTRRLDRVRGEAGAESLGEIVVDAPGGFRLLPGVPADGWTSEFTSIEARRLVEQASMLTPTPGIVLIDAAAGIGPGVMSFALASDWALVVVTPEPTSIADAYAAIKTIRIRSRRLAQGLGVRIGVVVNQARNLTQAAETYQRMRGCAERFLNCTPIWLGSIGYEASVSESVRSRRPVMLAEGTNSASKSIRAVRDSLLSQLGMSENLGGACELPKGIMMDALRALFGGVGRGPRTI
jgi:flagellar biosynthesis protein FlhG